MTRTRLSCPSWRSTDGTFLGTFPHAFTHLVPIASASHLQLCSGEWRGAMQGTHADRVDRLVSATLGWCGIVSALAARRRLGRVTSSRASLMDDGADADDNA